MLHSTLEQSHSEDQLPRSSKPIESQLRPDTGLGALSKLQRLEILHYSASLKI